MAQRSRIETWATAAGQGDSFDVAKLLTLYHPRFRARVEARLDEAMRARLAPEDILQEVYLQVFRQIDQFAGSDPDRFANWVYTILDHKLIDSRRAAHRRVRDVARDVAVGADVADSYWDLLAHVYADSGTPSRGARRREALEALPTSLAELSETHRKVIELRYLEGLPVQEVAKCLGKSEGAIKALTQRALAALRHCLDQAGEFTRGV